jgi:signal transduction histidine kinase
VFLGYAIAMACMVVLFNFNFPFLFITPIVSGLATVYITATSWKKITGPKWIVLAGLVCTMLLLVLFVISEIFGLITEPEFLLFLISLMLLTFPVSLLIFTAVSQRNLLLETRLKAKENLQLAKDKLKTEEENRRILSEQNIRLEREVEKRTGELKESLEHLKATQSQLIQSEKMASLGELTAGIAHEIQNPLNFVNNFSEVSKELIGELSEEVDKGNYGEVKAIASDLVSNLEKINLHGKRADAIVKGMLAHSRTSSGQKEPTDINALCDEYLRLAYHGMKAKDQTFSASFHIEPDDTLPKVNVIPQDIGRVLLNLLNNAFYAVQERSKKGEAGYNPEVVVSTASEGSFVKIMVKDNGGGIPESIRGKIFQPFFTTKPTGKGTGLGLSLSYDIVTKGHGGKLFVRVEDMEYTIFTMVL